MSPPAPLWLAIHLPLLSLEARLLPSPSVIGERHRLVVCDAAASGAGLRPGMRVTAARALLPAVHVFERNAACEQEAMERLACWAGEFTPHVSLVAAAANNGCHALLLDIGPCLRLFGGIEVLTSRIGAGLREQGMTARLAAAPLPQAALWLAAGREPWVGSGRGATDDLLRGLSLDVLPLPAAETLRSFGMRTLGDVRLLPGNALARRIDADTLAMLGRGFGDLPDPRPLFAFPERFSSRLELPAAVASADMLLFAAHRLVAALAGWLAARQAGIRELALHLLHRPGAVPAGTPLVLRFAGSTRDGTRIERVLRERLQRLELRAPVEWLQLDAMRIDPLPGQSRTLFDSAAGHAMAMDELIERLRARLGEERVFGLAAVDDHRPECATQRVANWTAAPAVGKTPPRPFWLLPQAKPLRESGGRPCHGGPLQLLSKPERIESGWWAEDGVGDVRRDYFVALSAAGSWLWIYRDWKCAGWFLHGFFA